MTARSACGAVTLVAAVASMLALGVYGVGHGGNTHLDTPILYLAGKYWLAGSAYTQNVVPHVSGEIGATFEHYTFAYPPQSAPLFTLLAIGSVETSYTIMTWLNLLSLAAVSWIAVRLAGPDDSELRPWIVPALVVGNLSTVFAVWMGQTTLIITAAIAGAWYGARCHRPVLAGVLLAIATMKPPLSMLVALWFVLERQWQVLAAMTVAILGMAALPMYTSGPVGAFTEWLATLATYAADERNAIGARYLFNLQALLFGFGIDTPNLLPVGVLATIATWYARRRLVADDVLAIVIGLTMLFGYGHSYDVAVLVLLIPAFWQRVHEAPYASAVALLMLVAISFPNSALEPLGPLVHLRVAVLAAAVAWLLRLSVDAAAQVRA